MPRTRPLSPAEEQPASGTDDASAAGARPPSGVLERGIAILESFNEDRLRLSLREFAELTGLDKATLLRLLGVLVRARMVHRFDSGSYAPGPALLHMGMLYRSTFDLGTRLQPVLHSVMRQTGETVAFYVRSGDERVCLYRENTSKEVRHHVEVGTRIRLADGGSSAHVLNAFTGGRTPQSREIRDKGYAMTRSERVAEMTSVALPVFDSDGTFLGALVVIGLASRFSDPAKQQAVEVVRRELAQQSFATRPPADWQPGG
ncbi:IclR family transcriptional regulator [Variovorax terrae]|uniref:IclR family transcriptional regulator n=1 Tax=Variovorax terrae TaxID=2923278 RepID=A0A9X1VXT4_9BURK|nr:IclR family transcriptional regulator [Variovorax terrae]MCJ0763997.1 IclR family transcriptional regulator [Variovorax terrae]